MPAKDIVVKEAIQSVMGNTRKGRNKIIRLVQKLYPLLGSSKIVLAPYFLDDFFKRVC